MSKPSKHRAKPKVEISVHLSELENLESELFQTEDDPFFFEEMPFCRIQEEFPAVHRAMVSTIKSARENLAKEKELMQRLRHGPWESEEEEDLATFADENSAEYADYMEWHEIIYHMIAPATAMTLFVFL